MSNWKHTRRFWVILAALLFGMGAHVQGQIPVNMERNTKPVERVSPKNFEKQKLTKPDPKKAKAVSEQEYIDPVFKSQGRQELVIARHCV